MLVVTFSSEAAITARVSHPFQVKERPIRMNIPNAVQLPAKSFQVLIFNFNLVELCFTTDIVSDCK